MSTSSELYYGDPSFKNPILISSIPALYGFYSLSTGTIGANSTFTLRWVTTADRPQVSLWNFVHTLRLGTNDANHTWPYGSSLTANEIALRVTFYTDALDSDDAINRRYNNVVMRNDSGSTITFFSIFKSYTFSTSVGQTS